MAEIKVRLTGDNADFQRKLREATAESRAAAIEMREQFGLVKEKALDVAGESGLGKISGILTGLSGGPVAAFGAAIVGAVGEGIKKTIEWESIVTRIGTQLGSMQVAKDVGEFLEKAASVGVGPNKEQLAAAYSGMIRGRLSDEEAKRWIPVIQNLSSATGIDAATWGEMVGGGTVGITKGLMRNEDVRRAMEQYGQDPLKSLFILGSPGGAYGNAIQNELNTTAGRFSAIGRGAGELAERVGGAVVGLNLRNAFPQEDASTIRYSNPAILNKLPEMQPGFGNPNILSVPNLPGQGFGNPNVLTIQSADKLDKAADKLNQAIDKQQKVIDGWGNIIDVR